MKRVPFCHKGVHRLGLNSVQKNVYTVLVSYADGKGLAWPNWGTMLADSGLSRPALGDALTVLMAMQLIREHGRVSRAGGGKKTVVWEIAEIDNDGNVSPFGTHTPEPEPELPPISDEVAPISDEVAPKPKAKPKAKPKPKPKPKTSEIPAELLAVDGFADAWADWVAYRQQAKLRPLTAIGTTRQFSAMVKAVGGGVDVVACIDKAITSNWQSVHLDAVKAQSQSQSITKAAPKKELNILDKMRLQIGAEFDEILKEDAAKTTSTIEALPF